MGSSNLPSSISLSHSSDFEQKKWPQPLLLFWPSPLWPLPSPRLVLDSLHRRPVCPWSRECQTRASSLSSTTGPHTSSAPTQTHPLPGVPQQLTVTMRLCLTYGETVQCPPPPPARLSL